MIVGAFSFFRTQKALDQQIRVQIDSTNERQVQKIQNELDQSFSRLIGFSNKLQLRLTLNEYNSSKQKVTQNALNASLKEVLDSEPGFHDIHLASTDGTIIASTSSTTLGKDFSKNEAFLLGKVSQDNTIFFKDSVGILRQYLATPLEIQGKLIGVGIIEQQIDDILFIVSDYAGLGNTGESYLLRQLGDGTYQYITPLRFKPKGALTIAKEGPIHENDYRGVHVLSTTRKIGKNWTLVTEIDQSEVNAPALALRNGTLLIILIAFIAVSIAAWYLSRMIARPIQHITETVGKIRKGDVSTRVRIESNDEVGLLASAFNEMTDELVESKARLLASVLGLTQGFMIIEKDGTILISNDAAAKLLQSEKSSATIVEAFSQVEGIDLTEQFTECLENKRSKSFKDITIKGTYLYVYFSPITIDDESIGIAVQIADVTEERILQRSRDEFFSIASHELRTPLTAIRGNAKMIEQFYGDKVKDPDFHQMIEDIHGSSVRLIEIVNDFLDASRLEQGKIQLALEIFDIDEILENVVYEMGATANEKNNDIKIEKTLGKFPSIYADKNRVKQIVYNLMGNAMKFTEKGTIALDKQVEGDLLKISVTDTGPGISEVNQKLLFHKFQQANDSLLTRDTSRGTGLGLYISKMLCENMGGKLSLDHSEPGKGSTFSFTLPIATKKNVKTASEAATKK